MTIAICLITSNRTDCTRRTLTSLRRHLLCQDAPEPLLLLHGDDASDAEEGVFDLAAGFGFETVHASKSRVGGHRNRRAVVGEAVHRGAKRVLMLENDWEWVRPFPWALYEHAFSLPDVFCLRLYGQFKERGRRPCDTRDAGTRQAVDWTPLTGAPEPAEVGQIHWAAPPSVADASVVMRVLQDTDKPGQARRLSSVLGSRTVRPVNNVVYHIGAERTPGFIE